MKSISPILFSLLLSALSAFQPTIATAQAIAPEKSARAAAISDSRFINSNIQDNQDIMFLSQKAADHATDARIKELAGEMITDYSAALYAMEELRTAGAGAADQKGGGETDDIRQQAAAVNAKLSSVSGSDFDSSWVGSLLIMHQVKYDELAQAKETVTNPRLKMVIGENIPIVRKYLNQLKKLQKELLKMALQKKKEEAKKSAK